MCRYKYHPHFYLQAETEEFLKICHKLIISQKSLVKQQLSPHPTLFPNLIPNLIFFLNLFIFSLFLF